MQLSFWPLGKAPPLSTRQRAVIEQVLALFGPTIFLVPATGFRVPLDGKFE